MRVELPLLSKLFEIVSQLISLDSLDVLTLGNINATYTRLARMLAEMSIVENILTRSNQLGGGLRLSERKCHRSEQEQ